ncbi:MAG TPA: trypsin-like peptidase domain-containing protein [Candidatus Paceibacterota bacterium]|nr:trypsin-like peptidase domain-containing protein [Candidatus Paceibacterota bacterium]
MNRRIVIALRAYMLPFRRYPRTLIALAALLLLAGVFLLVLRRPSVTENGVAQPAPAVAATATPDLSGWAAVVAASEKSGVAIQAFRSGQLIRYGTGTVVSSDGLIATTLEVVPYTTPAAVYQVASPAGVARGYVVARDTRSNLALLKVEMTGLSIAQFVTARPAAGTPLALVGSLVQLSSFVPYFAHAWFASPVPSYGILDAVPAAELGGIRVVGADGRQAGIGYVRGGQVRMTYAADVEKFVQDYLQSLEPNL